jgi:hypothetical protein
MSSISQVRHVMVKDARQLRWPLLAYVAVVALATIQTAVWPALRSGILDVTALFVVVAGMIVAASLIHADSPIRPDAFWASRPLSAAAVLAAKFVSVVVLVIGIGVVGQIVGLHEFDVAPRLVPGILARSVLLYSLWLTLAMVVAGLTRDLRSFVVALVLLPICLAILSDSIESSVNVASAPWTRAAAAAATFAAGVGLLVFLYRTRSARPRLWAVALIIAAPVFVWAFDSTVRMEAAPSAASSPVVAIRLARPIDPQAPGDLHVAVDATPASMGRRLTLTDAKLTLYLRDGSTAGELRVGPSTLCEPIPPALRGFTWLGGAPWGADRELTIPLSDAQRQLVARVGVQKIDLDARVVSSEPRIVGAIPATQGASLVSDGIRLRIESVWRDLGQFATRLHVAEVAQERPAVTDFALVRLGSDGRQFVLVNDSRREATGLVQFSSTSGSAGLVLPGPDVSDATVGLKQAGGSPTAPAATLDDAWLASARVAVITWTTRDSNPVHATLRVP